MKTKLINVLAVVFLTLLAISGAPHRAEACSGDDCGCNVERDMCLEECRSLPPEYLQGCRHECIRASIDCGIACCDPYCPIVIPMDSDHQARFTDLTRGVLFDIDADGIENRISWTDPRSHTVFLALDRDGDHTISDGSELFGNHTEQSPSAEPNGFLALAEFDTPSAGGNGDGVISEDDAIFADLLLWDDANHDGRSQPAELRSLAQGSVVEIELRYHETQRSDRFGNYLRYNAKVVLVDGQTKAFDVFFLGE